MKSQTPTKTKAWCEPGDPEYGIKQTRWTLLLGERKLWLSVVKTQAFRDIPGHCQELILEAIGGQMPVVTLTPSRFVFTPYLMSSRSKMREEMVYRNLCVYENTVICQ